MIRPASLESIFTCDSCKDEVMFIGRPRGWLLITIDEPVKLSVVICSKCAQVPLCDLVSILVEH